MLLSIKEAAGFLEVTPMAVRQAVRQERMNCIRNKHRVFLQKDELIRYRDNRWKRGIRFEPGEFSPHQAAVYCGVPVQRIYYLLRLGALPCYRKSKQTITIKEEDLRSIKFMEEELRSIKPKKTMRRV